MRSLAATPAALAVEPTPGRFVSLALALGVHAAFFALIVFGVAWQSSPAPPLEAELWDRLPPVKSPPPPAPEASKPDPTPTPVAKPPEPAAEEVKPPPAPDPAIIESLKREQRAKEKEERRERERLERQKEAETAKRREEQRRQDEERAKREAERLREAAASAKQAEIERWKRRIEASIRGRANVPDTVSGKPIVQVRIRILPGGEVLDIAVTKKSTNSAYDTAIERAIRSASPLPVPPANSELFPQFRDLILNIEHER
ncbi:MAG TPA: TonB family protein [Usitatibacter sp.]|nr:TonB family protein [Usitatibacter sp.]